MVKRIVRPDSTVLEIGTATGEILDCCKPALGVGVDISQQMIELAKHKFPQYTFICSAVEKLELEQTFDYIIMVDIIDHVYDVMDLFESVRKFCHPNTKVILATINPWWGPILSFFEKIKLKMPEGPHNFIEKRNLINMIEFLDFSVIYSEYLMLLPIFIPILSFLANTIGVKIWGLNKLSLVQYMVLRSLPRNENNLDLGCSVIIPCYNEKDNIKEVIQRVPKMGKRTEIIVVDDASTDKTQDIVRSLQKGHKELKLLRYDENKGKGYAVEQGFNAATEQILMILDADMTVPPEELPRFFNLLNQGKCDFVNGTRMVYPMQDQAMRFLNIFGNKISSLIMTFLIGQHLTDTLCGTKALYKKDYQHIRMGLHRWGDFDLLFGAAKLGNRITEIPVHYMARKADQSKMDPLRHGLHVLKAYAIGFKELILKI